MYHHNGALISLKILHHHKVLSTSDADYCAISDLLDQCSAGTAGWSPVWWWMIK